MPLQNSIPTVLVLLYFVYGFYVFLRTRDTYMVYVLWCTMWYIYGTYIIYGV